MDNFEILKIDDWAEGRITEAIYRYQTHLIKGYVELGMLPSISSMNFGSKTDQAFLKETIGNLIEELSEADEVYDKLILTLSNPPKREYELLGKYSEELSDTLHFFIELMIYSEIYPEDILSYYEVVCRDQNLNAIMSEDGITTGLRYGRHLNIFENPEIVLIKSQSRVILDQNEYEQTYFAGYYLHDELNKVIKEYNWNIAKTLLLGANFLKNKKWVQGQPAFNNLPEFQKHVMKSFTYFMGLLDLLGWDSKGLFISYQRKNLIVQERIKLKY